MGSFPGEPDHPATLARFDPGRFEHRGREVGALDTAATRLIVACQLQGEAPRSEALRGRRRWPLQIGDDLPEPEPQWIPVPYMGILVQLYGGALASAEALREGLGDTRAWSQEPRRGRCSRRPDAQQAHHRTDPGTHDDETKRERQEDRSGGYDFRGLDRLGLDQRKPGESREQNDGRGERGDQPPKRHALAKHT